MLHITKIIIDKPCIQLVELFYNPIPIPVKLFERLSVYGNLETTI